MDSTLKSRTKPSDTTTQTTSGSSALGFRLSSKRKMIEVKGARDAAKHRGHGHQRVERGIAHQMGEEVMPNLRVHGPHSAPHDQGGRKHPARGARSQREHQRREFGGGNPQ